MSSLEVKEQEQEIHDMSFSPSDPLVLVFNPIEKLKKLVVAAKIPYTEQQLIALGLEVIKATRDFEEGQKEWNKTKDKTSTILGTRNMVEVASGAIAPTEYLAFIIKDKTKYSDLKTKISVLLECNVTVLAHYHVLSNNHKELSNKMSTQFNNLASQILKFTATIKDKNKLLNKKQKNVSKGLDKTLKNHQINSSSNK